MVPIDLFSSMAEQHLWGLWRWPFLTTATMDDHLDQWNYNLLGDWHWFNDWWLLRQATLAIDSSRGDDLWPAESIVIFQRLRQTSPAGLEFVAGEERDRFEWVSCHAVALVSLTDWKMDECCCCNVSMRVSRLFFDKWVFPMMSLTGESSGSVNCQAMA